MAMSTVISVTVMSTAKAADTRKGNGMTSTAKGMARRGLLLSAAVAMVQEPDSRTDLLKKYLKKSEENKAKNDKERLESYYKRNYRDYFGFFEGTLKQKKEQLSDSEKGILDWLESNK